MVTDQDDSLFDHHPTTTRGFTETVNWALKHAKSCSQPLTSEVISTLRLSRAWKRERSGRWRQSAAGGCSARGLAWILRCPTTAYPVPRRQPTLMPRAPLSNGPAKKVREGLDLLRQH